MGNLRDWTSKIMPPVYLRSRKVLSSFYVSSTTNCRSQQIEGVYPLHWVEEKIKVKLHKVLDVARFLFGRHIPQELRPQENMAPSPRVNPKNMAPLVVLVDFLRLVRLSVLVSLSHSSFPIFVLLAEWKVLCKCNLCKWENLFEWKNKNKPMESA